MTKNKYPIADVDKAKVEKKYSSTSQNIAHREKKQNKTKNT